MTEFVCPQPQIWHKIHEALKEAWENAGSKGVPPPVPLILGGWNFTDDWDKKTRWDETVEWTKSQEFEHLIPKLHPRSEYRVDEIRKFIRLDPFGGYNEEPREAPDDEAAEAAMEILREDWKEIVGEFLAKCTAPVGLCGPKKRRLVVLANASVTPPWGSWTSLTYAGRDQKETFTRLRVAINTAIAPLVVDHVDFPAVSPERFEEHLKT